MNSRLSDLPPDVVALARDLAFEEVLKSEDVFAESILRTGEVENVYPHLRRALLVVSERRTWNNSGWIGNAIGHLERAVAEFRKLNSDVEERHLEEAERLYDDGERV